MGLRPSTRRRRPHRRRILPRGYEIETEVVDPTEETTDITYRASTTEARTTTVRVELDPRPDTTKEEA